MYRKDIWLDSEKKYNLMTFGINFEIHLIMILQKNMEDLINEKYKKNFL